MKNLIHVAMACDDNYAHHFAVAICSILNNLSEDKTLRVYLLHEKLENITKEKIEQIKKIKNFEIEYININCEKYEPFKILVGLYISRLTYARFQLPNILPSLDKCLYLDCDTLVRRDLGELWDIKMPETTLIGAVEEPAARFRCRDLCIPEMFSYFNAGIILMNLDKLRKFSLEEKAFSYLKEKGSLKYADQDVLNALFYDTWYALPLKWNVHSHVYILKDSNKYFRYSDQETKRVFSEVAIVHFSHELKPDSLISDSPFREEYWWYLKLTAWKYMYPKDITLKNLNIRIYWCIKKYLRKFPLFFISIRAIKRYLTGYKADKCSV